MITWMVGKSEKNTIPKNIAHKIWVYSKGAKRVTEDSLKALVTRKECTLLQFYFLLFP